MQQHWFYIVDSYAVRLLSQTFITTIASEWLRIDFSETSPNLHNFLFGRVMNKSKNDDDEHRLNFLGRYGGLDEPYEKLIPSLKEIGLSLTGYFVLVEAEAFIRTQLPSKESKRLGYLQRVKEDFLIFRNSLPDTPFVICIGYQKHRRAANSLEAITNSVQSLLDIDKTQNITSCDIENKEDIKRAGLLLMQQTEPAPINIHIKEIIQSL